MRNSSHGEQNSRKQKLPREASVSGQTKKSRKRRREEANYCLPLTTWSLWQAGDQFLLSGDAVKMRSRTWLKKQKAGLGDNTSRMFCQDGN